MATETQKLIPKLVEMYGYKPIPPMFSEEYHQIFLQDIPDWLSLDGEYIPLYDAAGVQICKRYTRIVVGDYGPFVEIADEDICKHNLRVQPGQEYRSEPRYLNNIKYLWWTTVGTAFPKLYEQKRTVDYADYKVGFWYVSPFEVQRNM